MRSDEGGISAGDVVGGLVLLVTAGPAVWLWQHHHVVWFWLWIALLVVGAVVLLVALVGASAEASREQAERDRQLASTDGMSGPEFESLIARLLVRDGWRDVRICGGSGDHGVDIKARSASGTQLAVQCKRYASKNVTPSEIRDFGSARAMAGARAAMFVTTSSFSNQARVTAEVLGITLIDRSKLGIWMASATGTSATAAA